MGNKINRVARIKQVTKKQYTQDKFKKLKEIGKGSFGKVYLVEEKETGKIFAMKVLVKKEMIKRKQIKNLLTEHELLEKIKCPFIVDFHSSFQNKEKIFFVMEYLSGGDLYDRLNIDQTFSEERVLLYAASIIMALQTIHEYGAIYRDLKPENILIDDDGYLKLIDFGLSKILKSKNKRKTKYQKCKTCCGTLEYIAPEVILGEKYGTEADYWSLGIILYEMLHGMPPFYSDNKNEMYEKIINDEPKISTSVSSEMQNLIRQLLNKNPEKRLGSHSRSQNIRDHPIITKLDWQLMLKKQYQPEFIPKSNELYNSQVNSEQSFQEKSKSLYNTKKNDKTVLLDQSNLLKFKGFSSTRKDTQVLQNIITYK
ncbi:non-specific serine/threonine protein kinase [Anaeramoeba flamelloides]|uniref:Non-specific serine/threonine protein kinase n=1 Tax=Anaeramoeba flamelloides TaxID=1746091 RepID=A0AAV7ZLQ0_9EUKA|nr:non-specific serine/threonine protein kinase [Anaeramoeba flamelloides]